MSVRRWRGARACRIADRARASSLVLLLLPGLGCVPLRGGWDREALVTRQSLDLDRLAGERLGDLVPVPALDFDDASSAAVPRVRLIACRFASGEPIRIHARGQGWEPALGELAISAFAALVAREGVRLEPSASRPAQIEVDAEALATEDGPEGLGDTWVECGLADGRARIERAEVRMRRSGPDAAGRVRRAGDEAWVGALLHELAHALGFSGHVAAGESLLARDESVLRRFGRRVLRGQPLADPTLAAFLRLESGVVLGERKLGGNASDLVAALRLLDVRREAAGNRRVAIVASTGDREARWSLRYADGSRLGLRFPGFAERLRDGRPLFVWPDRETREAILAAGDPPSP